MSHSSDSRTMLPSVRQAAPEFPSSYELVFSAEAIAARVHELGQEIAHWWRSKRSSLTDDLVALPVLRGGVFFFADLVRALPVSVDVAPIQAQAYERLQNGVQTPTIRVDYEGINLRGRSVLVVDDICDSGRTLEQLERLLLERGAREVRTAVLVRRLLSTPTFVPCWVGLEYRGDDWLIGYGMDDGERWRNLSGVYRKRPEV